VPFGAAEEIRMTDDVARFFVLTGGPGSGKSTLIDALARTGHAAMPEAGRAIIQEQVASNGHALPWADRAMFAEKMLTRDANTYRAAREQRGLVFFDRGIPDVVGYLRLCGLRVPAHAREAATTLRYDGVFILPPWPDIFTQDSERKQDFAEAVRTYDMLASTYADYGYAPVEVPRASIDERCRFILDRLRPTPA
jgi:predicted ATPase